MQRREFITLLGGAAAAWPLAARAQQPAMPVIGFLNGASPEDMRRLWPRSSRPERSRLRRGPERHDRIPLGGRPISIDCRRWRLIWFIVRSPSLPRPALLRRSRQRRRPDDSIVFTTGGDPIQLGLVASLSRPGGNVTGSTQLNEEVGPSGWNCCTSWSPRRPSLPCSSTRAIPYCRDRHERRAGGGSHARAAAPCPACQHRTRFRCGLRKAGPTASRRARDRPPMHSSLAGANSSLHWRPPRGARDLPVSRVRRGRRPDELRRQHYGRIPSAGV